MEFILFMIVVAIGGTLLTRIINSISADKIQCPECMTYTKNTQGISNDKGLISNLICRNCGFEFRKIFTSKKCDQCLSMIPIEARKCKYCASNQNE